MGPGGSPRTQVGVDGRRDGSWAASVGIAVTRIRQAQGNSQDLLNSLVASAAALLDAPAGVALLEGGELIRRAVTGEAAGDVGSRVEVDGTICGQVMLTGRPALYDDTLAVPAGGPDGRCCPGARSVLCAPLLSGWHPMGLVWVVCDQPEWFDDVDSGALVVLAAAAADSLADRHRPVNVAPPAGPSLRPGGQVPAQPRPSWPHPSGPLSVGPPEAEPRVVTPPSPMPVPAPKGPPGSGTVTGAGTRFPPEAGDGVGPVGALPQLVPWRLGLWQWDAITRTVTCSPEVADLLGLPASGEPDLAGIRDALHPDDVARFEDVLLRQAAGARRVEGTFRVMTEGGTARRLRVRSELLVEPDGSVSGGHGVLIDVTEQDRESAGVHSRLLGLHAAQQLTGVGLWEWHPETGELIWSAQMYPLVGLAPGHLRPTLAHWHHFVHPEDLDRARRLDVQALDRDGGLAETFRVIGADGVLRYLQSWSQACPGEGGTIVCGAAVDVTRQVRDRMLIDRLSATDPVTGLGNRFAFDRRLRQLLDDPSRDVALLLLDLDRFKSVNDSLGHQIGDRLLVEVSRRLAGVVPGGSVTARMGGDEFVVMPQPGIGWLQVRRLAQTIVESLRMPYVLPDGGEILVCPVSVGVTSTSGREVSAHELLSEADLALYEAKDSGRDRYVVFDDALRDRARTRHLAERSLRSALEEGRLNLQYQPIVDLHTGSVIGAEALVRIRDTELDRLLPPEEFIDVAEDTGLVVEIDCWVIDTALEQMARWQARGRGQHRGGRPAPWLAINVSARSMEHPRVVSRLLDGIRNRRLPAGLIKVELTERSFLGALPGGESALQQLIGSGVPVGIDDFGTGYSALAYLQRFDLDFMKIDRSFVTSLGDRERADAVVTAIVDLAHAHDMKVTAEGIEHPRQARRLREIGCDFAQGFYFGRPGEPGPIVAG